MGLGLGLPACSVGGDSAHSTERKLVSVNGAIMALYRVGTVVEANPDVVVVVVGDGDGVSGDGVSTGVMSEDVLSGNGLSERVLSGDVLSGDVLSGDVVVFGRRQAASALRAVASGIHIYRSSSRGDAATISPSFRPAAVGYSRSNSAADWTHSAETAAMAETAAGRPSDSDTQPVLLAGTSGRPLVWALATAAPTVKTRMPGGRVVVALPRGVAMAAPLRERERVSE